MTRANWQRVEASISLDLSMLTELIRPVFPGLAVIASEPAMGGLSNTNLRLTVEQRPTPVRLRLFTRHPERAALEIAVMTRAAAQVPVPRVFHIAESNPVTGHPYALYEWVDGVRLELAAADAAAHNLVEFGHCVGATMARIHSVAFDEYGFFDASLAVARPITLGGAGLTAYFRECFVDGRGGERLGPDLTERLLRYADRQAHLLDSLPVRPCLTHGDFGGSNILMRRSAGIWQVAAILDWEYAFSGTPFFDFGNLLRPPLGDAPAFAEAVADSYRAAGGALPENWLRLSRMTDLFAWADLMSRDDSGDEVIADARATFERCLAEADAERRPN